jgi:glutamate--cysteine ligase
MNKHQNLEPLAISILNKKPLIEEWFSQQTITSPIYSSVDLRDQGFKVAAIDTNLFPAGFNNLDSSQISSTVGATREAFNKNFPGYSRILIIPESHTRNIFYFENLAALENLLNNAGLQTEIGTLRSDIHKTEEVELPSKKIIQLHPLLKKNNQITTSEFVDSAVLLNNDLSEGIPDILQNLEQPIAPPLKMGWFNRSKSLHFELYQKTAIEFANYIGIDPWLINPLFETCNDVDFMNDKGVRCLSNHVGSLLIAIQSKYDQYGINYQPFVVIKTDAGTYGMGVMMVSHPDEVNQLNRKDRVRMSMTKGKTPVKKVLIQEGIYSVDVLENPSRVREPVIYLIGNHVIGGFYRTHSKRTHNQNLNAPGMHFEALDSKNPDKNPFYTYSVIARLAMIAASHEIEQL